MRNLLPGLSHPATRNIISPIDPFRDIATCAPLSDARHLRSGPKRSGSSDEQRNVD
jgi:hypothetical protein